MINTSPLVSVLMTAYNREKYISEAIESVLASSYTNLELIIVDDCSKDHTVKIAQSFALQDSRVKVYINAVNLGDYYNRNKAASYAKGKYLKYLDSDDLIHPWGLQAMVHCMEKSPSAALGLSTNIKIKGKLPVLISQEQSYKLYYFNSSLLTVGPSASIIRRDVFEDINGFSGKQFVGDTELWLKIAQTNNLTLIPDNLIYWREHEQQQICLEQKDEQIDTIRYQIDLNFLTDVNCPLSKKDTNKAIFKLKKVKSRIIVKGFILGNFASAIVRKKNFKLTLFDLLKSFKKIKIHTIIIK